MDEKEDQPSAAAPEPTDAVPAFRATQVINSWKYTSPLMACRFDPSGQFVFTAAQDQTIQRWNLASGEFSTLAGHDSWLRGIDFAPDGTSLYSAGYDGCLLFWDLSGAEPTIARRVDAHDGWVRWLSVSPSGKLIATCGNDHRVNIWSAEDGTLVHPLEAHQAHVYSVMFHPTDETCLLSGDLLGKVCQWELPAAKVVREFDASALHSFNTGQGAHYGGVRSMSLSPDGQHLACGGLHKATNPFGAVQEPLVVIFSWETAEPQTSLLTNGIDRGIVWRAVYHPTGTLIGASGGGSGGFLLFWDDRIEKTAFQFQLPNTALDMDLHRDGKRVATAHHDRHVRISELATS